MQGAHDWAENLDKTFKRHGYYKLHVNPQIWSKVHNDELTLTSTWTDDILGTLSTLEGERLAKLQLGSSYEIKDLEEAKFILRIWIDKNTDGDIILSQQAYCEHLLNHFNMTSCSSTMTPLSPSIVLSSENCPTTLDKENEMKKIPFHEALGSLIWLQVATRPDLIFSVNMLACFAHNPGIAHWNMLKHVLTYIKGTKHYSITYKGGSSLEPIEYVDSNYASCRDTRRSTEGNVFVVASGPISWECKRQDTMALPIVEAEFMAFSRANTQALWISKYFDKVGLPVKRPIIVCADNSGSIANSTTDKNYRCTKHIDIRHHFIKEYTKSGNVVFQYTPTSDNIADVLTKPLPRDTLWKFVKYLGLTTRSTNTSVQGEYWSMDVSQECFPLSAS